MDPKAQLSLSSQIASDTFIWTVSIVSGVLVFCFAILLQWLIYDDWMHRNGPLRVVGSLVAAVLTIAFVRQWQVGVQRRKIEILRRFERIRWMNDRIRNSLQAIECVVFANHVHVTDPVREAVDEIESVLHDVLTETQLSFRPGRGKPGHGDAQTESAQLAEDSNQRA
jgi:hypothetical protein